MILIKPSHEILTKINYQEILQHIETAGRVCYKSEDRIKEESAAPFIKGIIRRGHESVIEHFSITVKFICDRGVTHEIVRHRLVAYSQESTRYCNYKGGVTFIIPSWIDFEPGEYNFSDIDDSFPSTTKLWYNSMWTCERRYISLLWEGWSPQQARSVLPNSLKTEIVMTANIREWRHILKLRTSKAAHPQMREIMIPLRKELQEKLPVFF